MKPSTESVASFCALYLEDHRDAIAPTTYAPNSDILRAHVVPALGRVSLAKFTPQVGARWKADQLKAGLAPATVRKHLIFVSAAMELAVGWGLIARNPWATSACPRRRRRPSMSTRRPNRRRSFRRRPTTATRRSTTSGAVRGAFTCRWQSTSAPACDAANCSDCEPSTSTSSRAACTCGRHCARGTTAPRKWGPARPLAAAARWSSPPLWWSCSPPTSRSGRRREATCCS